MHPNAALLALVLVVNRVVAQGLDDDSYMATTAPTMVLLDTSPVMTPLWTTASTSLPTTFSMDFSTAAPSAAASTTDAAPASSSGLGPDPFPASDFKPVDFFHNGYIECKTGGTDQANTTAEPPDQGALMQCLSAMATTGWAGSRCGGRQWYKGGAMWNSPEACWDACGECVAHLIYQNEPQGKCRYRRELAECWMGYVTATPR